MPEGKKVSAMFSSIAERYDTANLVLSGGICLLWQRALCRKIKGSVPAGRRNSALDICTGTGALLPGLLKLFRQVTGLDFCAEMLEVAGKRYAGCERLTLVQGDALKLPFGEGSFDAVTVAYGVRNLENLKEGLREMRRVLKEDGSVFILEFGRPPANLWGRIYKWYSSALLPWLGGVITGNKSAYGYLKETSHEFPAGEEFAALLKEAGFFDISAQPLSGGIAWLYSCGKRS